MQKCLLERKRSYLTEKGLFSRKAAGGEWIRTFSSAMPPPTAWAPSFGDERPLIRRNSSIGFAEAHDCLDDTAAPTVNRPQLGRSLQTAGYLARNWKFESIPLQQRVERTTIA